MPVGKPDIEKAPKNSPPDQPSVGQKSLHHRDVVQLHAWLQRPLDIIHHRERLGHEYEATDSGECRRGSASIKAIATCTFVGDAIDLKEIAIQTAGVHRRGAPTRRLARE